MYDDSTLGNASEQATLAIHGLLPLVRRQTATTSVTDVSVQEAYRDAHSLKVEARDNAWLCEQLSHNHIAEMWRVGTPTLGQLACSGTTSLVRVNLLPMEKAETFRERVQLLLFTRRNVHCHLDYGSIGQDFGDDLCSSFLPLLNDLATIYCKGKLPPLSVKEAVWAQYRELVDKAQTEKAEQS
jgi:hypothetical protein